MIWPQSMPTPDVDEETVEVESIAGMVHLCSSRRGRGLLDLFCAASSYGGDRASRAAKKPAHRGHCRTGKGPCSHQGSIAEAIADPADDIRRDKGLSQAANR